MIKIKHKLRLKIRPFTIITFLFDLAFIAILVIIYTPIINFKNLWVTTAMTTMNHQYLAYTLYSEEDVNKIMDSNYIEESKEAMNLDDIIIGDTKEKKHYKDEYERAIYTRDKDNDVYKIIRINEKTFKGYLTVVYDPKDVTLAVPKKLGKAGTSVNNLVLENDGLVGINGGGFEDLDGWGNGSKPYGAIIKDGKLLWDYKDSGGLIGFTKTHKLWLTNKEPEEAIKKGMNDAVEFGPYLIINGKKANIHGDGGWGIAPRTVIAQRKDGIVLFLVIEGRLPGYSVGADLNDTIELLSKYGAYNAANLDGGASSTMSVNGKLYNKPSAGGEYGGRTVSNAWIVTNKAHKKVPKKETKKIK